MSKTAIKFCLYDATLPVSQLEQGGALAPLKFQLIKKAIPQNDRVKIFIFLPEV